MLKMKTRLCSFLIATLHILSWVSAASRPFAPHDVAHHKGQLLQSAQLVFDTSQVDRSEEGYLSRLGSRPPNCLHKCGGCIPCIAIQVPTTADKLGVQYANYEPEGWKCKCGPSFFDP